MERLVHRFRNNTTSIPYGNKGWEEANQNHVLGIRVKVKGDDKVEDKQQHEFVNFCSCSYLGLNSHPKIIEGAHRALEREKVIAIPISRIRVQLAILDELERELSDLFRCRTVATLSASCATTGVLPLVASGHLMDDQQPRVMVFDRFCHFSMNLIKPICADETTVLTAPHNDLDFLEDICKKHKRVAYVADGAYSMGGATVLKGLLELQDRYGLFLFFDDSHSISIIGERGEGFVRSQLGPELNPLTCIVGSLAKAFGSGGGFVMLGPVKHEPILTRFGGPLSWSQGPNVPTIGATLASIEIHRSPELGQLQKKLQENVALFDSLVETPQRDNGLNIKLVNAGSETQAAQYSGEIYKRGFYTSAVFFPILERGKAGLRVMIRADNQPEDIRRFSQVVRDVVQLD